jgi:mannitol-1-phosphate/altronate dehydrogenase
MVDRITPSTSPDDRDRIEREFQIADRWPVVTESFAQWVIEDRFCNGRPPLELVDALFVSDVTPYKLIKNRLLNGTHSALGYLGYLAGHRRTDEVMADPILADFIEQLMRNEVVPLLPSGVAGMELSEYCDTVLERLGNPAIGDELSRLCRRGSTKMADYLLPSLATARADGRPAPLLTLAVAGWLRYVRGTDLQGQPIAVTDGRAVELAELEQAGRHDPATLLDSDIFGELAGDRQLSEELAGLIGRIDEVGVRQVIREGLVRS